MECSHGRKPVVHVARQEPSPGGAAECSHGRKPVVHVARQEPSPGGAVETQGSHPSPLRGLCDCAVLIPRAHARG